MSETFEPAPGILGGEKSLAAYLAFMGVDSLQELEREYPPPPRWDHQVRFDPWGTAA